jgi:hypothetical protein
MNIPSEARSMRHPALAGLLAVAAALPAAAQTVPVKPIPPDQAPAPAPGEEPKNPRRDWLDRLQKQMQPDAGEEGEEKRADPIKTLEEVVKLMAEAEEYLNAAAARKALDTGREIERKLEPPPPSPDKPPEAGTPPPPSGESQKAIEKMKLAQEKIDKLLGGADKKQKDTIELINLLIRQARQVQQSGQQQQQRQQQQQQQRQQPQNQPNATNPAQQPYTPPPTREGTAPPRTADRADRWGDLPPHMRDETNQGMRQVEEFPAEYRELLQEYYKRLSGGE